MINSTTPILKYNKKLLSKHFDRTIDGIDNLQTENKREIERDRVHKDLFRQFPNRPRYGYVCPQFELELR